jgi:hypothetical protein
MKLLYILTFRVHYLLERYLLFCPQISTSSIATWSHGMYFGSRALMALTIQARPGTTSTLFNTTHEPVPQRSAFIQKAHGPKRPIKRYYSAAHSQERAMPQYRHYVSEAGNQPFWYEQKQQVADCRVGRFARSISILPAVAYLVFSIWDNIIPRILISYACGLASNVILLLNHFPARCHRLQLAIGGTGFGSSSKLTWNRHPSPNLRGQASCADRARRSIWIHFDLRREYEEMFHAATEAKREANVRKTSPSGWSMPLFCLQGARDQGAGSIESAPARYDESIQPCRWRCYLTASLGCRGSEVF